MKLVRKKCVKEQSLFVVKIVRAVLGMRKINMGKYHYALSENGWEYTGYIEVESDEKPICVCDTENDEYYLLVNDAKISFDE